MCLIAKHVRVVCLRIAVWCCMICLLCVVCCVWACGVECGCGLFLAPYVKLSDLSARFCVSLCLCVFCL